MPLLEPFQDILVDVNEQLLPEHVRPAHPVHRNGQILAYEVLNVPGMDGVAVLQEMPTVVIRGVWQRSLSAGPSRTTGSQRS